MSLSRLRGCPFRGKMARSSIHVWKKSCSDISYLYRLIDREVPLAETLLIPLSGQSAWGGRILAEKPYGEV